MHEREWRHARFNQEASSIPNSALLNGKTSLSLLFFFFSHCANAVSPLHGFDYHICFIAFTAAGAPFGSFITLMLLSDRLTIWIDERRRLMAFFFFSRTG